MHECGVVNKISLARSLSLCLARRSPCTHHTHTTHKPNKSCSHSAHTPHTHTTDQTHSTHVTHIQHTAHHTQTTPKPHTTRTLHPRHKTSHVTNTLHAHQHPHTYRNAFIHLTAPFVCATCLLHMCCIALSLFLTHTQHTCTRNTLASFLPNPSSAPPPAKFRNPPSTPPPPFPTAPIACSSCSKKCLLIKRDLTFRSIYIRVYIWCVGQGYEKSGHAPHIGCNTLQRNALQHTATHCNALQRTNIPYQSPSLSQKRLIFS